MDDTTVTAVFAVSSGDADVADDPGVEHDAIVIVIASAITAHAAFRAKHIMRKSSLHRIGDRHGVIPG
ncbi:MAG: hypothetical protein LKF35_03525 [Bifidobacterium minimum]|nr:hypothetical protein [Bifidobacterium minimum]